MAQQRETLAIKLADLSLILLVHLVEEESTF